ncbi:MAG: o-succinylbenzoate synthase [Candidatus Pristimantibacillus lignocellulolyticus]|uniref:o-succinylbenzoate synthase n=1 Tax=Candidatus Pristimantibacillus lignocellulolyticus TaxID=2994561 RepID=A0A9J6ZJN7_9BACL|nr:MAG: o-succinylbenzoate synthase [Candidatus Pristimantibacillus lignocellulolyticus]
MITIQSIELYRISMELKAPFVTANGAYVDRETILIEVTDREGNCGWGECVAFATPWYTEETVQGSWHILQSFLIPTLLGVTLKHPNEIPNIFSNVKRNQMAKAGLEMAIWDLYSQLIGQPLHQLIGGVKEELKVGVAIGLQSSMDEYYRLIDHYSADGYERMKIKIKPGNDITLVEALRSRYPKLPLMVDANSAYDLNDIAHLQQLDDYNLMMIEQPLAADDIVDHAKLQAKMNTPICLDESIITYDDARKAIELGSCQVINVKLGRVGGMTEAIRIHDLCKEHDIAIWCGGMLESGIGRAHNMALASLSHFTIPGDISASARYWHKDVILPEVKIEHGGVLLPSGAGIGFEVNKEYIEHLALERLKLNHSR